MAKKPKAKSGDRTLKTAIAIMLIGIIAIGTVLAINSHNLSFVMTVNGQRVSTEHYRFHFNNYLMTAQQFIWQFEGIEDMEDHVREFAREEAIGILVINQQARERGIALTAEQIAESDERAQEFIDNELMHMHAAGWRINEREFLRSMGFSRRGFNDLFRQIAMIEALNDYITANIVVTEEQARLTFDERVEQAQQFPDIINLYDIMLYYIETETHESALNASLDFTPTPGTDPVSIWETNANMDVLEVAFELFEVGAISGPIELDNGNYMVFQIVEIVGPDYDELWVNFLESYEEEYRWAYFESQFVFWREQAEVTTNERAFNLITVQ